VSLADPEPPSGRVLERRVTRRGVVTSGAAALSIATAYAALGDPLGLFRSNASDEFDESRAIERESVRVNHLLRRAGFGVSKEEHDYYQSIGLDATISELLDYESIDDSEAERAEAAATPRNGTFVGWLARMANTKRPLQEKMTLFWHGLLTTQLSATADPDAALDQIRLFRRHALDDFGELLHGVTRDRSMMVYLDVDGSEASAPNENYARELMELFAMGSGYTEQDIREAARAFTGWTVPRDFSRLPFKLLTPVFDAAKFDAGDKTVLGYTGNFGANDIVHVVLDRPQTGPYIVRRIFEYLAYPDPDDATLAPFVEAYEANRRRLKPVVEAILRSDAFYSPRAYRGLPKAPVEFAVGVIKALGGAASAAQMLPGRARALRSMGQVLFEPPSVAGWPGGSAWFTTSMLFARLNFINQATGGAPSGPPGQQAALPPVPEDLGTASQALAHYLPFLLDDNLSEAAQKVLLDYAGGPRAKMTPESLRGLVYLVMASPQYQLA
jgi:uncharacterized protein (DUF1800 family)